ncbi:ATP-binding protein [Olegusella massiliensis]|uniref:ATP-binding protein n=1 Tax=Olegusella massiliensis TaxID=1776381 RepID=UPI0040556DD5
MKGLIYGLEGIGKSTLAAQMPDAVFIDVESGTNQLPVARLPKPTSWTMLLDEVRAVRDGEVPCMTLIIDTADAAQRLCMDHVCSLRDWDSIESPGWGRGYTDVQEEFSRLLDLMSEVVERGRNAILISHAILSKFERPDEQGSYDRYSLKLIDSKRTSIAALCKEWADMVLFCDYKTILIEDSKTKTMKAAGGQRIVHSTHSLAWDAKNRYGLPEEFPLDDAISLILPHMARSVAQQSAHNEAREVQTPDANPSTTQRISSVNTPTAMPDMAELDERLARMQADVESVKKIQTTNAPENTYEKPAYPARMNALVDLMALDKVTDAELRHAVAQTGNFPEDCAATDYEQGYVDFLVANWGAMLKRIKTNRIPTPFDNQ